MDKVQELLDERIEKEIQNLPNLEAGTKERSAAVEDLSNLYKLRIEEAKIEREREIKYAQLGAQTKDRVANVLTQFGVAAIGVIAYNAWFRDGLKFEQTGLVRSPWVKNLISRMVPRK